MRPAEHARVVDQLKRRRPGTPLEALNLCQGLLPADVFEVSQDEIYDIWKHCKGGSRRQQNEPSLPLSPAASSSSTHGQWRPSDVRRPLSAYPQCLEDSDPFDSPFVMPSNGRWFGVESKSHNTPGSYITAAKLREAEVDFDEEESIKLQCRPPKHLRGSFALRNPSQGRSSHCLTLFNIVSKEEADHIGMTNFDILYGADFDHDIHQQYKAERVDPQLVPPRAPWPPNHRPATPSESAESIDSRLERRPARHETQRVSAGYTMTYRAPDGGQLSLTAPESTTDFMGKVQGILPIIAAGPSLLSPSPMMIQSAAAIRNSRNISNRGTESHYPVSHVARSVAASVHTGFEHGHKRKATEDVAPAPSERRQQWADEPSGYRDQ